MTDDIREGRPSASSMGRLAKCHGSWNLIQTLKGDGRIPEDTDPGAIDEPAYLALGNAVHEYMMDPSKEKHASLSTDAQWMVRQFDYLYHAALRKIGLDFGTVMREQRLWDRRRRYSGQMDIGVMDEENRTGAVFDWKSGRVEVDPADQNYQLRALAVLMAENFNLRRVFAAIIQPRASEPLTLCEYDHNDLRAATEEMNLLMDQIAQPDAPLSPGDHCSFCPAKAHCPALGAEVLAAVVQTGGGIQDGKVEPTFRDIETLTTVQLSEVMAVAKRARAFFEEVEDRIKRLLKSDPTSVPGWSLNPDQDIKTIEDTAKAYEILQEQLEPEEFARACKVTITKLDDIFYERWKSRSTKAECKTMLRALLAPVMVHSVRSGSLKKANSNDTPAKMAVEDAPH